MAPRMMLLLLSPLCQQGKFQSVFLLCKCFEFITDAPIKYNVRARNPNLPICNLTLFFACLFFFLPNSTAPYKNFTQPPLVVADMMAGVGPFAVPLSMAVNFNTTVADREIKVHANGKITMCGMIVLSSKFLVVFLVVDFVSAI